MQHALIIDTVSCLGLCSLNIELHPLRPKCSSPSCTARCGQKSTQGIAEYSSECERPHPQPFCRRSMSACLSCEMSGTPFSIRVLWLLALYWCQLSLPCRNLVWKISALFLYKDILGIVPLFDIDSRDTVQTGNAARESNKGLQPESNREILKHSAT